MSNEIIDLGVEAIPIPTENSIARSGPRRMVKLAPVPGSYAVPIIWTGPVQIDEIDGKQLRCRICVVLFQKEPRPETMRISIPADFYDKLPEVPVEW